MDDLTDEELPGYAILHCRTPVGAFHKRHVVRLLELAGMDEAAETARTRGPDWYHLGPEQIDPVVAKINERRA